MRTMHHPLPAAAECSAATAATPPGDQAGEDRIVPAHLQTPFTMNVVARLSLGLQRPSHAHTGCRSQAPLTPQKRRCGTVVFASAGNDDRASIDWRGVGAAIALSSALCIGGPAIAELNKYEAAAGGEFNNGTAQQYGEATLVGHDFHGEVGDGLVMGFLLTSLLRGHA